MKTKTMSKGSVAKKLLVTLKKQLGDDKKVYNFLQKLNSDLDKYLREQKKAYQAEIDRENLNKLRKLLKSK